MQNTECPRCIARGYTISLGLRYNENLEVPQFLARANGETLGIIFGAPGFCVFTIAPGADAVHCGVAKELLRRCLENELVTRHGPIDIREYISVFNDRDFDPTLVQLSTDVGSELCEVMVNVNCPFQHPNDRDAQRLVDDACLTYFAAAREAGYNYGFFFVSL